MNRRFRDIAYEGVLHVVRRPLRSLLTALTSAIAIAVTVNVISLSFGFEEDIRSDVDLFGRLTVDVGRLPVLIPGARRPSLGPPEARLIEKKLDGLDAVIVPRRQVAANARADGGDGEQRVSFVAAPPAYLKTLNIPMAAGRWLQDDDPDGVEGEGVCVLDAAAVGLLFPDTDAESDIGRVIEVDVAGTKRRHRVIGVLEDPLRYRELFDAFDEGRGSRTLTSSLLSFRNVYVPETALGDGQFTGISIAMPSEDALEEARRRLLTVWSVDAGDPKSLLTGGVGVFVRKDWMDALAVSTRQGTLLGNLVWVIIVIVAVIMISTLNLITVRERYDEVALRRCEGARRRDVALQITTEGVLMSLVGGLAGLPIGYAGAALLRHIVDFPFRFEFKYAAAATGVAILLGLFASVLPARHAARLQPARVLGRRLR